MSVLLFRDPEEVDPSAKIKRDMKRKRKSMTKHKKILTKKDKSLPKVVPKHELTVTETAFASRLVTRTRSWINEVTPGMHVNTSTQPNAPTFVPVCTQHQHITQHNSPTPKNAIQRRREEFHFSTTGIQGKIPEPLPGAFSIGTQILNKTTQPTSSLILRKQTITSNCLVGA